MIGHLVDDSSAAHGYGFTTAKQALRLGRRLLEAVRDAQEHANGPEVLGCLRVFHAVGSSEHRALAELYVWFCTLRGVPSRSADDLTKAFGRGEESHARREAAAFYADSLLRLDQWLGNDAGISFEWDDAR